VIFTAGLINRALHEVSIPHMEIGRWSTIMSCLLAGYMIDLARVQNVYRQGSLYSIRTWSCFFTYVILPGMESQVVNC
jgi:Na+-transporting NADH:ubiquinone oxidoreductase subunit NqrB